MNQTKLQILARVTEEYKAAEKQLDALQNTEAALAREVAAEIYAERGAAGVEEFIPTVGCGVTRAFLRDWLKNGKK